MAGRARDSAEALLAALPEERRDRVLAEMAEEVADPAAHLVQGRAAELKELEDRAAEHFGVAWREVNPSVRRFLWPRVPTDGEGS